MLLILAGVSIAMLTGENGILNKAGEAKDKTNKETAREQVQMEVYGSYDDSGNFNMSELKENVKKAFGLKSEDIKEDGDIDGVQFKVNGLDVRVTGQGEVLLEGEEAKKPVQSDESTSSGGETPGKPNPDTGIFTESSTIDGKTDPEDTPDKASKNPIIPKGFKPVNITDDETIKNANWGNGKQAPESDAVNSGLVIQDKDGNQFVWVPVPDINTFAPIEGYDSGSKQSYLSNCKEPYEEGYSTEQEEYNEMKASVEKYGGFYIGRYEAGKDENGNIVVKQGATVYNEIKWGTSMTEETEGAVEKAKEFKKEKAWEDSAISTLIYGVQWDATMQFFDDKYLTGDCQSNSYVVDGTDRGNYNSNNVVKTGSNDEYAEKNIYDMAGNVREWTMEAYSTDYRIHRGGYCHNGGLNCPASYRSYNVPTTNISTIGFRVALYVR